MAVLLDSSDFDLPADVSKMILRPHRHFIKTLIKPAFYERGGMRLRIVLKVAGFP